VEWHWLKKLGHLRHIPQDIILFTTNPTCSVPRSELYMRDCRYSRKFINPSSWSRMWTGWPTDRVSNPEGGIFSHVIQSVPNCSWGQLASSSIDVGVPSLGTGGRFEVTTYFNQVVRLSKRGAISPLPTCIRL